MKTYEFWSLFIPSHQSTLIHLKETLTRIWMAGPPTSFSPSVPSLVFSLQILSSYQPKRGEE